MTDYGLEMKAKIISELGATWKNLEKRITIWAEVDKYRWREDESVYNQKIGLTSKVFECSMDGEFICFFDEKHSKQQSFLTFCEALKKLYQEGKIFVHEEMYEVKNAAENERIEKAMTVEVPEAHTPEEKVVADVLIKQAKKKHKKVKRTRK